MKKFVALLLVFCTVLALFGCKPADKDTTDKGTSAPASGPDESVKGKLVIYTTTYDIEYKLIIEEGFQKKYPNVQIETVQAGAGELKTRIKSEIENPQGDVMFGGLAYSDADLGIWEKYVSKYDSTMPESMRNTTGYLSWTTIQLENLLVNIDAAKKAGIDPDSITGFESLLNPALKGKIIWADPASSSSAWNMLATMLVAMGGYESEKAWDYVDKLLANGVVVGNSSSNCYKSVYEGEYVVGLTYEAPCVSYIEGGEGDKVKIVYMEEGTSAFPFASAIIKGAKNMEIAKLFIDYLVSEEAQKLWASSTARQANTKLPTTNQYLTDISKIKLVESDHQYLKDNRDKILEKFQQIYVKYN
ncbi:MAG: extracellular solute-binding protein [Clostridiales bacterium]|nr:extracellular solute-binding protein [Clostridiales bacterium]HOA33183.1 extracellular solute-binding protein [Clostridiales bacterium]HOJ35097.1 extracellular solute-binding protein [Clostridiales bacterium]HOL78710.1 extracellular solute-binding protein [Clostridiales bacterium]HPP67740.1 extracellular solute-binding protein [Clostridiales bacterium]